MKAIYLAIVIVLVVVLAALAWRLAGGKGFLGLREGFDSYHTLTVSWLPPAGYPFPQNLQYNWAFCMAGPTPTAGGCGTPPSDPSTWLYHGTVAGPSLTLGEGNCFSCAPGYKITLMLQAVDTVSKTAGPWVPVTIDLTYPAPTTVSILDASGQPLAAGSTGFVYALTLGSGAFAAGNKAGVLGMLLRGSTYYDFAAEVPVTSTTGDTATFAGSLTSNTLWADSKPPGPLQAGDQLTVYGRVFSPGKDGPVYYWGGFTATAQTLTPGSPSQVAWALS